MSFRSGEMPNRYTGKVAGKTRRKITKKLSIMQTLPSIKDCFALLTKKNIYKKAFLESSNIGVCLAKILDFYVVLVHDHADGRREVVSRTVYLRVAIQDYLDTLCRYA